MSASLDPPDPRPHPVRREHLLHILFPTITIALGWMLLFFKLRFNATRDEAWMDAYRFWVKVFACRSPWAWSPASP